MNIVGLSISQWLPCPLAIWAFGLDGKSCLHFQAATKPVNEPTAAPAAAAAAAVTAEHPLGQYPTQEPQVKVIIQQNISSLLTKTNASTHAISPSLYQITQGSQWDSSL